MSESNFFILFGVAWVAGMAYGLSAFRLLARVRDLRAEGKAGEAPDLLSNPLELFGYLGWLLGGRYAALGDDVATRWAGITRVLFVVAAPLILTVFVVVLTQAGAWSQPT